MKASPLPPLPQLSAAERRHCDRIQERSEAQLERLRSVNPVLLDLSIREPSVGTPLGHTVDNKLELLSLARTCAGTAAGSRASTSTTRT